MRIDLASEKVIALSEAPQYLPTRRGKRVHLATVYRWAQNGLRGIRLETIRVGATLCTSVEALQRFCERLSAPDARPSHRAENLSRGRQKAIERAEQELKAAGI